jgi:hypothetical protein
MIKISKRLKKILRKKSQQRRSRIKTGGNGELERATEQLLGNIEDIRNKMGDFDDVKPLSIPQPIPEIELIKNLDGMSMLTKMAEFGKKQIRYNLKQVSKYTDDLILELLKYDPNSISTFLIEKKLLNSIDLSIIRDYIPSSMLLLFGGVSNFISWLTNNITLISFPKSDKPKITKDILLQILHKQSIKYPTISFDDTYIRDLILKDLFKKLSCLNDQNSNTQLQNAGAPFFSSIASYVRGVAKAGVTKLGNAVLNVSIFLASVWIVLLPVVCWNLRNSPERCIRLNDL